ncbi:MAG: hypothetical protein EAY65_06725 [Alphaproteobacteria bacterium]|nr:MAG: hypothetical protein EAY65_06725 [Alphaproteobacteria bacterium]
MEYTENTEVNFMGLSDAFRDVRRVTRDVRGVFGDIENIESDRSKREAQVQRDRARAEKDRYNRDRAEVARDELRDGIRGSDQGLDQAPMGYSPMSNRGSNRDGGSRQDERAEREEMRDAKRFVGHLGKLSQEELQNLLEAMEAHRGKPYERDTQNGTLARGESLKLSHDILEYARENGFDAKKIARGNRAELDKMYDKLHDQYASREALQAQQPATQGQGTQPATGPSASAAASVTVNIAGQPQTNTPAPTTGQTPAPTQSTAVAPEPQKPVLELKPEPKLTERVEGLFTKLGLNGEQTDKTYRSLGAALEQVGVKVTGAPIDEFAAYTAAKNPELAKKLMDGDDSKAMAALKESSTALQTEANKSLEAEKAKPKEVTVNHDNKRKREDYHARLEVNATETAAFNSESRMIMDIHTAKKNGNDTFLQDKEIAAFMENYQKSTGRSVFATHPYTREALSPEQQPQRGQGQTNGHQIMPTGGTFVREGGKVTVHRDGNTLTEEQARQEDASIAQNIAQKIRAGTFVKPDSRPEIGRTQAAQPSVTVEQKQGVAGQQPTAQPVTSTEHSIHPTIRLTPIKSEDVKVEGQNTVSLNVTRDTASADVTSTGGTAVAGAAAGRDGTVAAGAGGANISPEVLAKVGSIRLNGIKVEDANNGVVTPSVTTSPATPAKVEAQR